MHSDPKAFWAVFGIGAAVPDGLERRLTCDDITAQKLCTDLGDAAVLKIELHSGRAVQVTIWKGISSGYEIFYSVRSNGDVLVADHFRNMMAQLPVKERVVSEGAVADHFLFRTVPGTESHCKGVTRAALGERVTLQISSGNVQTHQFDRIDVECERASIDDYVDWADEALQTAIEPLQFERGVVNLFSGGVDSTLVQSYLSTDVPALTVERSDNASGYESRYAARAAELAGAQLHRKSYDTSSFLEDLSVCTRINGLPPMFFQKVSFRDVWGEPYRKFVTGLHADTLYGFGGLSARLASPFASAFGNLVLRAAAPVFQLSPRLNTIRPAAESLRKYPMDPFGFAGLHSLRGDLGAISRALGSDLVRTRLERRLAITVERAPAPRASLGRFYQHTELAHWLAHCCGDGLMRLRHTASAHNTAVAAPFYGRSVVSAAARVPPEHRYIKGFEGKYLLKRLLKRRLPAYPTKQRKGQSTIPFKKFYAIGPLSHVWERYDMPSWFQETGPDGSQRLAPGVAQSAVIWAVWYQGVMNNPELKPTPGVQI